MTKRRRENKPERFVSKHQLTRWEKQKRMRNIIVAVGLAVIVAVVAIVGWGYYDAQIRPFNQTAIKVNDTTFNMRYYIDTLKMYKGYAQNGYIDQNFAGQVTKLIEQQEELRQAAKALGYEANQADAQKELKDQGATKITRPQLDAQLVSDLIKKLKSDYFTPQVAANQAQARFQGMLLESQDAAAQAKARLAAGESFDTLASELSREAVSQNQKGAFDWTTGHQLDLLVSSTKLGDAVIAANTGIQDPFYDDSVNKTFGFWVVKVLDKKDAAADGSTPKQVHAEGILVASEQDAQDVINKLNAGADFETLAREVSLQPGLKEGYATSDMGTLKYDSTLPDYQKALFDLSVGTINGPISNQTAQTKGGYWLINIQDKDPNKGLTDQQKSVLAGDLMNTWSKGVSTDPKNKVEEPINDPAKLIFAIGQASK